MAPLVSFKSVGVLFVLKQLQSDVGPVEVPHPKVQPNSLFIYQAIAKPG